MSSEKEAEKSAKPEKRSKKKKLILIVAAALMLVGGAGAYLMLGKTESAPKPGKVITLEPITMNLTDGHYLKLHLALQATADAKEVDGSKALDLAVSEFSNRPIAELSGSPARESSKNTLRAKVSEAYSGEVMDVYFTEFVTQ
ncbi:MAG: flagellar basal body-associated protein FliL [Labedaea sp.]